MNFIALLIFLIKKYFNIVFHVLLIILKLIKLVNNIGFIFLLSKF